MTMADYDDDEESTGNPTSPQGSNVTGALPSGIPGSLAPATGFLGGNMALQGFAVGMLKSPRKGGFANALANGMLGANAGKQLAIQQAVQNLQAQYAPAQARFGYDQGMANDALSKVNLAALGIDPNTGQPYGAAGSIPGQLAPSGVQPQGQSQSQQGSVTGAPGTWQGVAQNAMGGNASDPVAMLQRAKFLMMNPNTARAGSQLAEVAQKMITSGQTLNNDGSISLTPGALLTQGALAANTSYADAEAKLPAQLAAQNNEAANTARNQIVQGVPVQVPDGKGGFTTQEQTMTGNQLRALQAQQQATASSQGQPMPQPQVPNSSAPPPMSQSQEAQALQQFATPSNVAGANAIAGTGAIPAGQIAQPGQAQAPMMPQLGGKPVMGPLQQKQAETEGQTAGEAEKSMGSVRGNFGNIMDKLNQMSSLNNDALWGPGLDTQYAIHNLKQDQRAAATSQFRNANQQLFTNDLPLFMSSMQGSRVDIPIVNAVKGASQINDEDNPLTRADNIGNLRLQAIKGAIVAGSKYSDATGQTPDYSFLNGIPVPVSKPGNKTGSLDGTIDASDLPHLLNSGGSIYEGKVPVISPGNTTGQPDRTISSGALPDFLKAGWKIYKGSSQ